MHIRTATQQDRGAIRAVHLATFPATERDSVAQLAVELLDDTGTVSLVAEAANGIAGHVAFSPVTIDLDGNMPASILAPLAVHPGQQKQGIGTTLIKQGIEHLTQAGTRIVFVYGDPAYYGRFGFSTDAATQFSAPYKLKFPSGWQAMILENSGGFCPPGKIACVPALHRPDLW